MPENSQKNDFGFHVHDICIVCMNKSIAELLFLLSFCFDSFRVSLWQPSLKKNLMN